MIQSMRCNLPEYRRTGTTEVAVCKRYWILTRISARSVVSCRKEHRQQCCEGPRQHDDRHNRAHRLLFNVAQDSEAECVAIVEIGKSLEQSDECRVSEGNGHGPSGSVQ